MPQIGGLRWKSHKYFGWIFGFWSLTGLALVGEIAAYTNLS